MIDIFLKSIAKLLAFIIYVCLLFIVVDFTYGLIFEKLPPLRNSVYLQMYNNSIHRRSRIECLFYELRPYASSPAYFDGTFRSEAITINSFGMRDREISKKKKQFRVLVLGDSVTFALEAPQDKRFTEVAEDILNADVKQIEILNAGVCCYNTKQEFTALKEKYLKLSPDLVIFAYCNNDLGIAAVQFSPDEYPQKILLNRGLQVKNLHYTNVNDKEYLSLVLPNQFFIPENINRVLLLKSGIYRFLSLGIFKTKNGIRDNADLPYYLVGFDINAVLKDISKLASERGFLLRFLILPTPPSMRWDKQYILRLLNKHNILFWDFDAINKSESKTNNDLWVGPDDLHLNIKGHQIIGELLAREVNLLVSHNK